MKTFMFNTDAAANTFKAADLDAAIDHLVETREWEKIDSAAEKRCIEDGAFLILRDGDGNWLLVRGNVP